MMPPDERAVIQVHVERLLRGLGEWLRTNQMRACYSRAWAEMPEERGSKKTGRAIPAQAG